MDAPSPYFQQQPPSTLQRFVTTAADIAGAGVQTPQVQQVLRQRGFDPSQVQTGIQTVAQTFAPSPRASQRASYGPIVPAAQMEQFRQAASQIQNPETQQMVGEFAEKVAELTPTGAAISKGIKVARAIGFIVAILASILLIVFLGLAIYNSSENKSAMGWEIGALIAAILAIAATSALVIGDWYHAKRQRENVATYAGPFAQGLQAFQGIMKRKR